MGQIDCAVTNVKDQGVFCEAGPLLVFVAKSVSTLTFGLENILTKGSTYQQA